MFHMEQFKNICDLALYSAPVMLDPGMIRILFVCSGNICRSPTAEGVMRVHAERAGLREEIELDSAGLHDFHQGEPPDHRSIKTAIGRGFDIAGHRARKVTPADFSDFDLIVALDRSHLDQLRGMSHAALHDKITLLLSYAPQTGALDVPDPYYGGQEGFEITFDLIERGVLGLLATLNA
jgi:protein-tyrosine phosphatase